MTHDRFGNVIDQEVGYARGNLIRSSVDEIRRLRHAQSVAGMRVAEKGSDAVSIFTGNPRYFPLSPEDLPTLCEEWVGPGLFKERLRDAALKHLGGNENQHDGAAFNRTSAAIVAAILALSDGRTVLSIVPDGDRSHASIARGCALAQVSLAQLDATDDIAASIETNNPALVIITTVTSALNRIDDALTIKAIEAAKNTGAVTLLDEAYGARLRQIIYDGLPGLQLGADMSVTNTDKAGLSGPRAGILAGRRDLLVLVMAKAAELGMEARAPIAAGAMKALENFTPDILLKEVEDGRKLADALAEVFGENLITRSTLGPMIKEEDIHLLVLERAAGKICTIVPAETTAALGMILLSTCGILTVNTHGQPGGKVSIRLKPTPGAVSQAGGATAIALAINSAIDMMAARFDDVDWISNLIFGE